MSVADTNVTATLLPDWLLRSLEADSTRPRLGGQSRATGAVLFVDLSGFSTLADLLEREARAGPERLAAILDECFESVVGAVIAGGGDVIRFAGDAVVAFFPAAGSDTQDLAVRQACAAALHAHRQSEQLRPWEGVELKLRMGIGAGHVGIADVGGEAGLWDYVAFGEALTDAAAAIGVAGPGETVLDPLAVAALSGQAEVSLRRDGRGRLERLTDAPHESPRTDVQQPPSRGAPKPATAAARAYLSASMLRRLEAGHDEWLAEYRQLSVLFVNLVEPGFAELDKLDQLQSAVRAIQADVSAVDGSTSLVIIDEKGVVVTAFFGLPLMSREDDAARALHAALGIHRSLAELGVTHGVGLTRGRAFCGLVGNDSRRDYVVLGHVVNVAARLMEAARGGVLCDSTSAVAAGGVATFEPLPSLSLKGIPEPVPVFRPLDDSPSRAPTSSRISLVGRTQERAQIARAIDTLVAGGDGAVYLLEGEAGIGKSVLLQDALATATRAGVTAGLGSTNAVERATPFGPWRPILTRLLGLEALADPEARGSRLMRILAGRGERAEWAPLLNHVLPVAIPDNETVRAMPAALRGVNTRDLLVDLLSEVSEGRPLVIAVDDVQWMDASSWDLAAALAQSVPRLLLLLSARPMATSEQPVWQDLKLRDGTVHLHIGRMQAPELVDLMCRRLRVHEIPPDVAEAVLERAEGHPFFATELALGLRDSGQLVIRHGQCSLAPNTKLSDLALPGTIQGVLNSRIDMLSPDEQLVLKVASVVGRTFDFESLEAALPSDTVSTWNALNGIRKQGLIAQVPTPDSAFEFEHALVQEAAYNLLPVAQRKQLHRSVAEHIEVRVADVQRAAVSRAKGSPPASVHRADAPDMPADARNGTLSLADVAALAHHWHLAEEPARAIAYLDLAGRLSLATGANVEASSYLEQALELAEAEPGYRAGQVSETARTIDLAEAYLRLGLIDRSRDLNESALASLGVVPVGGVRRALQLVREVVRQTATVLVGRERSDAGVLTDQPSKRVLRATAASRLVEHRYYDRDTLGAFHLCLLGINEAEACGDLAAAANAYNFLALGTMLIGREGLADRYFSRARRTDDAGELARADVTEGAGNALLGRWARAEELLSRSWQRALSINDAAMQGRIMEAFGLLDEVQNPAAALAHRQSQTDLARSTGNPHQIAWGLLGVCAAQLARGDYPAALETSRTLTELVDEADITSKTRYRALQAAACMATGNLAEASASVDQTLALMRDFPSRGPTDLAAVTALAETCLAMMEHDRGASDRAREALDAAKSYAKSYPAGRPRADRLAARLAELEGKPRKAIKLLMRSLRSARQIDATHDEAQALLALATLETRESARLEAAALIQRLAETPPRLLAPPAPSP